MLVNYALGVYMYAQSNQPNQSFIGVRGGGCSIFLEYVKMLKNFSGNLQNFNVGRICSIPVVERVLGGFGACIFLISIYPSNPPSILFFLISFNPFTDV